MTLIEGDGIGPEISAAVVKIFEAAQVRHQVRSMQSSIRFLFSKVPITWERVNVKPVKTTDGRITVPEEVFTSMKSSKIGLKGHLPL